MRLAAVILVYLAVGTLYATQTPPYNAPDEPAHANYVRDIAQQAAMPVLQAGDWDAALLERLKASKFPPGSDVSAIRYEGHQPPLYYLVVAPVARVAVGLGERGQLIAVRLATLLIGAGGLLALAAVAGQLFPGDSSARLAAVGLAAFIPMHVAVGASVSNDALAELMLSLVLWRSLIAQRSGLSVRSAVGLGALVGLGLLTKLSCFVGLPLALLAVRRWRQAIVVAGVALLIALPWWARGALFYGIGDPLGLRRHDEIVIGQTRTTTLGAGEAATLFRSFWGQFGWMGVLMDERVYLALMGFMALLAFGVLLWLLPWGGFWREIGSAERRAFGLTALLVLAVMAGTAGYNLTYLQPQGRYLFPAMAGIAVLAVAGARELVAPRQRPAVYLAVGIGLVGLDLLALYRFVVPALAS